jgi:hypothetical protein
MPASPSTINGWAANSWALVVGIDQYDVADVPSLTGAVADAVAAVKWLRTFGVPDSQILVNASPSPTSKPDLDAIKISTEAATFGQIWASIHKLCKVADGARLFIFLSGHGLYDAADGRLFLTQDYGVNGDLSANLGLDAFKDFFLSLVFLEQFFFFDGCQNYPVSPSLRSPVKARTPPIAGYTPRPENGMAACYAASQNQFALEIDGRGAMLHHLLNELDWVQLCALPPHDPRHSAIIYDWHTGRRTLDLRRLFLNFVKPVVTEAAGKEGRLQTPVLEPYGTAAGRLDLPILELPAEPTAELRIAVEPPQATDAVAQINISLRSPRRDYYLPPLKPPLVLPDACRVPQKGDIEPLCYLNSDTSWVIKTAPRPFTVSRPQHDAVFELERKSGRDPTPLAGQAEGELGFFNIRLMAADGKQTYVPDQVYVDIHQATGLDMPTQWAGPDGVIMWPHEYGPDFAVLDYAPDGGRNLIDGWARAFARIGPGDVDHVVIVPPGKLPKDHQPNLEFRIPNGARALGGFLTEERVVFIERASESSEGRFWRGNGDYSLGALEDLKRIRVEPGYHRIRVELPWGNWTDLIDVRHKGVAVCQLPEKIGLPPLRNTVAQDFIGRLMARSPGTLMIRSTERRPGFELTRWRPLRDTARFKSGRVLSLEFEHLEPHARFATIAWPFDRTLAIDLAGSFPRAEPYSTTPIAEWDLLVTCGRLDAIAPERLSELCHGGWASMPERDDILGIALAYAAHTAEAWDDLRAILGALGDLANSIIDVALLERTCCVTDLTMEEALTRRLAAGELPVFLWGLSLARDAAREALLIDRIGAATVTWSNWTTAFGPRPARAAESAAVSNVGLDSYAKLIQKPERDSTLEAEN